MNISIEVTGNLLEYIDTKVKKGLYKSRSEVIREAIREMLRRDLQGQMDAQGITAKELDDMRGRVAGEIVGKKYAKLA